MVELTNAQLDHVFHALGDPTRRTMLRQLAHGEQTISELAAPFDISLAAASKHVKSLERAGLIDRTITGRTHVCRLNIDPLVRARAFLGFYEQYWNTRLDALHDLFATSSSEESST